VATIQRNSVRELNGILLFDKASGETSNRSLQKVKRLYCAAKAGHTGTLDPLATGLLVICFGRATKISDFLLNADKKYKVTIRLGVTTTTADADGEILEHKNASSVTQQQIVDAAMRLSGQIEQIPPMHSALKHQGKRLYDLARRGVEVERKPRLVQIYSFTIINYQNDEVCMEVHCSKGTYIRTLVEDLGKLLGCGAHVLKLRRTGLGPFSNVDMHTFHELEQLAMQDVEKLDQLLLPTDSALQHWQAIHVKDDLMEDMRYGRPVQIPNFPADGKARIYDSDKQFYGIACKNNSGFISVKRLG
jgi:tRNA pseudouridine55 synthase